MSVSVLIVDDHGAFRATASDLLRTRGFAVAGHAADRRQAIRAMRRLRPAAVLLDVHLPDGDDLSLVRELCRLRPDARVLLTSSDPDATTDEQARRHGAVGFVAKTELASTDLGRFFTSDGAPDGPTPR